MSLPEFNVGDIVKIDGSRALFEIIGFVSMSMFLDGELTEELTYKLRGIRSKEEVDKRPYEMRFIRNGKEQERISEGKERLITHAVDAILDKYNDLMEAYEHFNDEVYLKRANEVMEELKEYFRNTN